MPMAATRQRPPNVTHLRYGLSYRDVEELLAERLGELMPSAWHHVEQYENNRIEADHGRLKHRLRPMGVLRTDQSAQVVIVGHAFVQNLRCGHYELALDTRPGLRVAAAFTELAGGGSSFAMAGEPAGWSVDRLRRFSIRLRKPRTAPSSPR
jgi:hypothetical protein